MSNNKEDERWTDGRKLYDATVTEHASAWSRNYIKSFQRGEAVKQISIYEAKQFVCFVKEVVKSGGYAIFLTTHSETQDGYKFLSDKGFVVLPYS